MSSYLNLLVLSLVISQFAWVTLSSSSGACDSFCFQALKPNLNHIRNNLQRWRECISAKLNNHARLENLTAQLVGRSTANVTTIELSRKQCGTLTERQKREIRRRFTQIGSKYYYIEKFHTANWFGGLAACREMGAHLVSFQSAEELSAVRKVLPRNRRYWTDINDLARRSEYMSETTGKLALFMQWSPGEPHKPTGTEFCVILRMFDHDQGMETIPCHRRYYHFICEVDAEL